MKRFLISSVMAAMFGLMPSVASARGHSSFSFGLNLGGIGLGYREGWGGYHGSFYRGGVGVSFAAPIYSSYTYCAPAYTYCAPTTYEYAAPVYTPAPAYYTYTPPVSYAQPVYTAQPVYYTPVTTYYYYNTPAYRSGYYYRR